MRSSSPFIAKAVRAITGIERVAASPLSSAMASMPSIPANWISIKMRWGCSARAKAIPVSASVTLITLWPAFSRSKTANFIFRGLSSTTSILATSVAPLAAGQGTPDFGSETIEMEVGFFHNGGHIAMQLGAILRGDCLGGHHHNGDAGRLWVVFQGLDHIETAHLGHQ